MHVKSTCRQGQRLRANKNAAARTTPQQQHHQQQRPAPSTCATTTDAMADVAHTSPVEMTSSSPQTMEYEPSHMAYARTHTSADAWKPEEIPTIAQLQAYLQHYREAARSTNANLHSTASVPGGQPSAF